MRLLSKLLHAPRTIALLLAALVFSHAAYAQVSFNLSQSWNLLGNSSASAINVATTFGDASKFTTVWTWNRTASKWAFYSPSMSSTELATYAQNKGYDVLTSIAPKEGFWVNAATATTLTGPVANGVTLIEGDLQPSWNLVSSADKMTPSQLNQALNASLGAAGKSMTTAWAWDAQGSKWRFYAPSLEAAGGTALTDYIANKQYQAFSAALSESEGFWLNIGAITPTNAAFVTAPVVNTPLDGVSVTLTCANGAFGGKGTASQGNVRIAVDPATCAAPYTMAVSGQGTMAGPDLKFGTADDETYDSAKRASLKAVIQATDLGLSEGANLASGASATAPAITSLTTMVAEAVAKPNFATPPTPAEITAAIANVQKVAGLSDPALVYANPLTNGAVFNAATLVNEMVANAMLADPTQVPNALLKTMAASTTVTLADTTINTATLMGMSAANDAIMQAQMATMQAKAGAMKSVADAIFANLGSASQASVTPAEAVTFLNTALAGASAGIAQQAIAQAQLAQDTMKQMAAQMATMQVDTSIQPADLAAKMAAMAQGLNSVRVTQDQSIQTAIGNAGSDPTAIANAVMTANTAAQSMITASAATLLSTVTSAPNVATLTNQYMSSIAGSITEQLAKIDPTQLATATSGPPANLAAALASINVDPAAIASAAATTAGQVSTLSPPGALANFPGLGDQVIGMVLARAGAFGWMTSGQLQAWVDTIGTALGATGNIPLLNQGSVGFTLANYFGSSQPDLRTVPPGTLTLTIGAAPTFMPSTMPTGTPPLSSLPLCSALPQGITAIPSGTGQNCNPATGGTTLPLCSTLGPSAQPTINCTPDTGGTQTLAQFCTAANVPSGYTFPSTVPTWGGQTCP